jgi:site-specific DNA recombinase
VGMASSSRHKPRRAALYARVSLDQTGEATSVSGQEESARELVERRGWTLAGVFVDNSITGTGKKHRPQFYAMLEAVKGGEIDAIVARHMDRIARNSRERLELVEACKQQGVIIALVEGSDMDPTTASGRMVIGVLGEMAEMEIALKGERHTAALRRHAHNGGVPHGVAPYGYTTIGAIVPDEAEIVARIFSAFDAGGSLRSITAKLTADGVPTRSGRPWHVRTVRDMLTNPRYAGWAVYRREIPTDDDGNRIRGRWDPIVTPEVFDVIQARLSDPSRKTNRVGTDRRYLGSGLFMCDTCESPIQTGNGGKYLCRGHLTREHKHVDRYVIDVIAERLGRKDFARLLARPAEDMAPVVAEAERLRKRIALVDSDYDNDLIDAKRWRSKKSKIVAELATVDKQLAGRRGGAALGAILSAPDPAKAFRGAPLMGQRAVIDALAVVRLRRAARGRLPHGVYIDPETVDVDWRR